MSSKKPMKKESNNRSFKGKESSNLIWEGKGKENEWGNKGNSIRNGKESKRRKKEKSSRKGEERNSSKISRLGIIIMRSRANLKSRRRRREKRGRKRRRKRRKRRNRRRVVHLTKTKAKGYNGVNHNRTITKQTTTW